MNPKDRLTNLAAMVKRRPAAGDSETVGCDQFESFRTLVARNGKLSPWLSSAFLPWLS
jgi:hypothetical protein